MAAKNDVALCVLTNRSLYVAITTFASGIPYFVHQVKQQLVCASDAYKEDVNAPQDMELWQNAVSSGDMQTLEALRVLSLTPKLGKRLEKLLYGLPDYAFTHTKDLALLDWQHESFPSEIYNNPDDDEADRLIGMQGDVNIVKWLLSHDYGISEYMVYGAAEAGNLKLIKYLDDEGEEPFGCEYHLVNAAAANGHLKVVQWLFENREPCNVEDHDDEDHTGPSALDLAMKNGQLQVVRYLCESEEFVSSQALADAVTSQQLKLLELLCKYRDPDSSTKLALELAAERGLVEYVKVLFVADPELSFGADLVNTAAANGHLELIQFFHLHDQQFEFTGEAMHNAAVNGHFEIVAFLHEHRGESCSVETLADSFVHESSFCASLD